MWFERKKKDISFLFIELNVLKCILNKCEIVYKIIWNFDRVNVCFSKLKVLFGVMMGIKRLK